MHVGVIWGHSVTWSTPAHAMKTGPALAIGEVRIWFRL